MSDFAKAALAVAWERGHRDGMADEFAIRENPHADIEESQNPYLAKASSNIAFVALYAAACIQSVRRLHVSDGADAPFCNECGHSWPCATTRSLDNPS